MAARTPVAIGLVLATLGVVACGEERPLLDELELRMSVGQCDFVAEGLEKIAASGPHTPEDERRILKLRTLHAAATGDVDEALEGLAALGETRIETRLQVVVLVEKTAPDRLAELRSRIDLGPWWLEPYLRGPSETWPLQCSVDGPGCLITLGCETASFSCDDPDFYRVRPCR